MGESIYKRMIEDSPIAYFCGRIIKDENNKCKGMEIVSVNESLKALFYMTEEELIGRNIGDILPKNIMEIWIDSIEKAMKNQKYSIESYIRDINLNCIADIYSVDNEYIYVRINKISETSSKLPQSIRRAPFTAWIKDINGTYLDVNEKFLKMEDVIYNDIVGKTDYYKMKGERANRYVAQDKEVIKTNKIHTYKDIYDYGDEVRYYEITKWPHIDENSNAVVGTMGIALETTNEVELIKELEKNQEIFLQIANNIEEIITIRDENKYMYISPAFEKIYGVKPEEINLYNDPNQWKRCWDSIEIEKEVGEYSYKGISTSMIKVIKNNEEKWLYTKYVPLFDKEGNISRRVGITSDFTNAIKIEKEIENLRMDFFANLSHELRTPITLILSALQVINLKKSKLEVKDFEYFNKYLNIINQNGLRLLKLVNNLIDTTKVDSGHFNYNPKNKDIISCIENVCLSVCEYAQSNNLDLIFDTDVEEKIIAFDQDNIERVILNLLSNAIKFNKPKGRIDVSVRCKNNIEIKVKDNGIGIPKDRIKSIFGRFEQVKNKMKNEQEGSGIGLYLVESLVKMHDGKIYVKSELGKGSEFTVVLPDVLIEDKEETIEEINSTLRNINNIKVEFSDIYFN